MIERPKYQIIAGISGTFTLLGLSSLIFNVHTTKKTDNLTYPWFFFILSAQILLALYGLLNNAYGIYVPALMVVTGLSYMLYIKLNHSENKIEMELIKKNIL